MKEQAAQEGSHGGGGKSAQNTAKAANEGGGQEKKSPTSNQDSKEAVGGGEDAVTIEENISKGKEALQKVIDTHDDVKDAMYRDDIGSIDFVWGTPGTGPKFKHGYGLAHIIAKRNAESGDGISVALKLVDVIGRGTNVEKQSAAHGSGEYRIKIHYDGYTAVLSSASSGRNAWLLTGWEDGNGKNPSQKTKATVSARGEGYDSSTATAATPTLTRRNGETIASVDSSIPQQKTKRNEKIGSFSIGKDGKKFTATLEERLGGEFAKDHAEALATLAGSYGGREKDGKYTFPTKKGRDGFLEVANAYLGLMREKGVLKASTAEDRRVRGIVRAMRIVPDAALGKVHSMLSGIGEMMGCPIVWVDANSQLNGIHYRNVTFLNRKAGMDLKKTFWHEQFHWIKANNTALYKELLSYFKGRKAFTKEQLDSKRQITERKHLH